MKFRGLFYRGFIPILILANLSSCSPRNIADINEHFRATFGGPVKKISQSRTPPPDLGSYPTVVNEPISPFLPPVQRQRPFPGQRPNQFGPESAASSYAPMEKLPEDIFDLTYSTQQLPPFVALGSEFDMIEVPSHDYYGINTGMKEKSYMIVGNLDLQKDVDQINNNRSETDIEISETLIKERQKQRQKYKMQKIFGEDVATLEKQKIKEEDILEAENKARKKRLEEEDPIKKAIALQVIQYNMQQNQPPAPPAQKK